MRPTPFPFAVSGLLSLVLLAGIGTAAPVPSDPALHRRGAGAPRSLRAERLLDRAWLRAHGIERPARLAFDDAGSLYVLDPKARRVVRLPLDPGGSASISTPGGLTFGEDASASWLPTDISLDIRGSLLVLDRSIPAVAAYGSRGEALGSRDLDPALAEEARAPDARLLRDPYGDLWLLAPGERDLVPLDARLARRRPGRFLVPEESLTAPVAVAFLPRGGGWVADASSSMLRRFDATGRLAARSAIGDSADARPVDLAADASGALFVADAAASRVLAIGADGSRLAVFWLGGPQHAWAPGAIACDLADRVAVADAARDEIWILAVEREESP